MVFRDFFAAKVSQSRGCLSSPGEKKKKIQTQSRRVLEAFSEVTTTGGLRALMF